MTTATMATTTHATRRRRTLAAYPSALYCYSNLRLLNKVKESVTGFVESMMEPLEDDAQDGDDDVSIASQLPPAQSVEAPPDRSEGSDSLGDGDGQAFQSLMFN